MDDVDVQGTVHPVSTVRTTCRLPCRTRSFSPSYHTCWSSISAVSRKFADDSTPSPTIPKFGRALRFVDAVFTFGNSECD